MCIVAAKKGVFILAYGKSVYKKPDYGERKRRSQMRCVQRKILKIMPVLCSLVLILGESAVIRLLEVRAEVPEHYEREISHEVIYEEVEAAAELPQEIEVEVRDGGEETVAVCALTDVTELESRWVEGFELPVTFHMYDAETYMLDDRRIPKDDVVPQLLDCEEELLAEAGLSRADYRITDVRWSSDSYEDETGELCRDALATGQKLVRTYRAEYAGTAVFERLPDYLRTPETEEVLIEETQESVHETVSEETEAYEREVTVLESTEEPMEEIVLTQAEPLWKKIVRILMYAVGIGILMVLFGLFILIILYMVKKVRLWYDRRKRKSSQRR
jgi:hypothetical protein